MELNELIDQVTSPKAQEDHVPPDNTCLLAIQVDSKALEELLNLQIPALLQSAIELETQKVNGRRVDGQIIGTGEADFTKGNTLYTLSYKGKTFQLIDVPGIEGDESKYAHMVRESVAKAHLVFYVNGTNKKPEKATAEKIRSYLRRGTQVCPIVNVRGNADAYEFEEDRKSLECSGGASVALKQTMVVLESVLKSDVLLPGYCVQGLLAFSSMALNSETGKTTIHPSREPDLLIHQRNYLKHFASAKAMFEFSQMHTVAQVLDAKLATFREDIIESNKVKVHELLVENVGILEKALQEHQTFIDRVDPEFDKCRESIEGALRTFERLISAGRRNLWSDFFNGLTEEADQIVAEYFGDNDRITTTIKKAFKTRQDAMERSRQQQFVEHLEAMQSSASQSMERLIQDVRRVEFQQRVASDEGSHQAVFHTAQLDMALSQKEWGSMAFSVGSYALTGAGIGSTFPVIGTAIGAVIGAAVGLTVSALELLTSKEKRIRKAQAQVHEKINEVRDKVMGELSSEMNSLLMPIRNEVKETTLNQVEAIYLNLARPLNIIQRQIALMTHIKNHLETMPHGTVQAIQR